MTIDEARKLRDLLSILLACAKDKKMNLDIHIKEYGLHDEHPSVNIYFKESHK